MTNNMALQSCPNLNTLRVAGYVEQQQRKPQKKKKSKACLKLKNYRQSPFYG